MNDAQKYLDFHLNLSAFSLTVKDIFVPLNEQLQSHLEKLKTIHQQTSEILFQTPENDLIVDIYKRVKSILKNNKKLLFTLKKRELRTLSYSLNYAEKNSSSFFEKKSDLELILQILDNNWRDTFLKGLLDCYLKNWESTNESKEIIGKFIQNKLETYSGNRTDIKSLKQNRKYLNYLNGDVVLGAEIALKNIPINESVNYLSLPDSYFTYPYFSKVILSFYEKKKKRIAHYLVDIYKALEKHKNNKTNKRVISKLIIDVNHLSFSTLHIGIKLLAFNLIGDPNNSSCWTPYENASDRERKELSAARNYLNEWITREFINVFFEKSINDKRRKKFWLKYSSYISQFKVFGSDENRRLLKADSSISELINDRYQVVSSNRDISAIMFIIGNYTLIEFSDPGYAFYAYKNSNPYTPSLDAKNINSVDDFRNGNMPMLVYRSGYHLHSFSNEGRLTHSDGALNWEDVFSRWILRKTGINV